ncbi:mitochondrial fission ELM1 family protein [Pleomorphomonas sp. JP5]|uniref:mitochondrial fission ELM1 family protein n=1 Tax=Pleomorphomonas sp. JP5 TaxID=2942998 RepID=UPI0020431CB7|nr:mitochondrial fission ELM1 family protein [Pleomorphomonas sp. JP5]MCM5557665.1 mitochondrial fission ELM1 family protein [Pleomorphomonas sp. JP5]
MTDRPSVWILTDGKAGDELPLTGIAEALGVTPELRHVHTRKAFALLMPWGSIDWRERPSQPGSPLAPPFPDICLATGRRAVAYLRHLKHLSPGTCTVLFKDPRTRRHGADLVIVQAHDRLRGPGVMVVTTAPNRLSAQRLDAIRAEPPADLAALPPPRLAVLIGGDSRHHHFSAGDIDRLMAGLGERVATGASLMITASRRTPPALAAALATLAEEKARVVFWNGEGANPFLAYMALADELIVTADSTNMIGEAATTGRPIQIFHPSGGHPKIERFIALLSQEASIGRFPDAPAAGNYPPINATAEIAAAVLAAWRGIRKD